GGQPLLGDGIEHPADDVGSVFMPGLDENVDDSTANAVGAHRDLIGQVDDHHAWLLVLDDLERSAPDFGLAAATTYSAVNSPVGTDEHASADFTWRAATRADDGGYRHARRGLQGPVQRTV